jgi:osmotically-inducible protein OsmY
VGKQVQTVGKADFVGWALSPRQEWSAISTVRTRTFRSLTYVNGKQFGRALYHSIEKERCDMDDRQLQQEVLAELDFEPSINAANIGVAADDGVVTLSGHVTSYAEKSAAEQAARRVKRVRAIAQEIEVRYPSDKKTADDEIAKRALSIIKWHAMIPQDAIQVTVQRGWITLSGQVHWQYQKRAAEDGVRKLSGVTGVTNTISLKPSAIATDIKKKIEDALARHAQIEAEAIRVHVLDGNRVELEGKVGSWEEREAAENAAWSVTGVQSVDDRLMIAP